jgi:hypothetical protein
MYSVELLPLHNARSAAFVERLTTPSRDRRNVAVTLSWSGGGSSVFLVGSFTNWTERVPMVAAENNTHVTTVHLRAGEHHYLFEVNGLLCIADEDPLTTPSPGSAPASIVNSVLVDDGSEYEELGGETAAAARPGLPSPTQIDDNGSVPCWSSCRAPHTPDHDLTPEPPSRFAAGLGVHKGPPRLAAAASRNIAFGSTLPAEPGSPPSSITVVGPPSLDATAVLLPRAVGDAPQLAHSHIPRQFVEPAAAPTPAARSAAFVERLTTSSPSCTSTDFSTVVPANLQAAWSEPPVLPPHLAQMHGVQTAAPNYGWPEGRPHADFADCKLNHAAFARANCGTDDDVAGSGCSSGGRSFAAPAPEMTISVTSRWHEHRVTNVLLKPTPARTAPLSTTLRRNTLDSASAAIPQLCAGLLRCLPNSMPASRAQSDESMSAQSDESMGEFNDSLAVLAPKNGVPIDDAPFSWMSIDFGAVLDGE